MLNTLKNFFESSKFGAIDDTSSLITNCNQMFRFTIVRVVMEPVNTEICIRFA